MRGVKVVGTKKRLTVASTFGFLNYLLLVCSHLISEESYNCIKMLSQFLMENNLFAKRLELHNWMNSLRHH